MNALDHISTNYNSILFAGFKHQPEGMNNGWVYSMPRYVDKHTRLSVYYLTNDGDFFMLDKAEGLRQIDRKSLGQPEVFFGRTLNSFKPDDPFVVNASLKILYPIATKIPSAYGSLDLRIIDDTTFVKPLPELERSYFFHRETRKEKLLLYPASISERKGQLDFAKTISKRAINGHKIIFCGTIKSQNYADECFETLKRRKVAFEYLSKVSKEELGELYRKSLLTLILSRSDYNPRTFYESMACGTPCLVSKKVLLASETENLAMRTSLLMLNRNLIKSVVYPSSLPSRLIEASKEYTEERCYNRIFQIALEQHGKRS